MKKINVAILSLALLALVSSPVLAQTYNSVSTEKTQKNVALVVTKSKQANTIYSASIKRANMEYAAKIKDAKMTYVASLKMSKTNAERMTTKKMEKNAMATAKLVRKTSYNAALKVLKASR